MIIKRVKEEYLNNGKGRRIFGKYLDFIAGFWGQ
jgi:hypothetical protein